MDLFTFIVIGLIIYSIFSKKDNRPKRYPTRPERDESSTARKPDFQAGTGQIGRESSPWRTNSQKEEKGTPVKPQRTYKKGTSTEYRSPEGTVGVEGTAGTEGTWGAEGAYYRKEAAQKKEAVQNSQIKQEEISDVIKETAYTDEEFYISQNEIVQGVIWAEILGKPRSKKPYRIAR